jgi:uncharacterized membrane protein
MAAVSRLTSVRNAFVTGLLLLAPLAVTWIVFSWLVGQVGGGFRPVFFFFVPERLLAQPGLDVIWNLLATLVVILLVTLLGYISRYVFSHFFGLVAERIIQSVPGVSTVYNTVKQIVETFGSQSRNVFSKVVLVEFPRKGVWSIGFLTNKAQGEPQARTTAEVWSVFVPTTPNPTSGFLVLFPKGDIIELDMSVGDGMKMIISGGTVAPPWAAPVSGATPPESGATVS